MNFSQMLFFLAVFSVIPYSLCSFKAKNFLKSISNSIKDSLTPSAVFPSDSNILDHVPQVSVSPGQLASEVFEARLSLWITNFSKLTPDAKVKPIYSVEALQNNNSNFKKHLETLINLYQSFLGAKNKLGQILDNEYKGAPGLFYVNATLEHLGGITCGLTKTESGATIALKFFNMIKELLDYNDPLAYAALDYSLRTSCLFGPSDTSQKAFKEANTLKLAYDVIGAPIKTTEENLETKTKGAFTLFYNHLQEYLDKEITDFKTSEVEKEQEKIRDEKIVVQIFASLPLSKQLEVHVTLFRWSMDIQKYSKVFINRQRMLIEELAKLEFQAPMHGLSIRSLLVDQLFTMYWNSGLSSFYTNPHNHGTKVRNDLVDVWRPFLKNETLVNLGIKS